MKSFWGGQKTVSLLHMDDVVVLASLNEGLQPGQAPFTADVDQYVKISGPDSLLA